jgi:hypothetical protein
VGKIALVPAAIMDNKLILSAKTSVQEDEEKYEELSYLITMNL